MDNRLKRLAEALYSGCPPIENRLPPLPEGAFRFFSYGRQALFAALSLSGVGKNDTVLLPEYICRDTLSAIHALGAKVSYYPVGEALECSVAEEALPQAKAIVAVNYFGFPQDLSVFQAYCERTGAVLVEDNAHGFLSRDQEGRLLGTRGDIGLFSFRKSVPLINGSGMLINNPEKLGEIPCQIPFVDYPVPSMFKLKKLLRRLPRFGMTGLLYGLVRFDRKIRVVRTGAEFVKSGAEAERVLPGSPEPDSRFLRALESLDDRCEAARRRTLFLAIKDAVEQMGGTPLFPDLPEHVVPYGFPFRAAGDTVPAIRKTLERCYIDFHPWPELPTEIDGNASEAYKSVHLVNFLW
ncbi:MAG: DegT/DnrJ/EryC1/StrS family aminotransferase [Betaproteobacteria bacterium]|nr:DegT/DnrJ/EryC1/StrS family aminotransferase [Betaproteobacteria bacterium]